MCKELSLTDLSALAFAIDRRVAALVAYRRTREVATPREVPRWMRAAGLILNVRLGLGVWDYSDLRGNLWGQIRLQFAAIWWGLCLVFIPVFDWMRYAVAGGENPRYRTAFCCAFTTFDLPMRPRYAMTGGVSSETQNVENT